ncbi:TldD/PmbA family protein [Picrophilus oshimae]|uniref:TldD protein n=1 Tax=Picrophilus torridus (strain ATCC 700027 / DSM 9790 / JCM 10055 / NBRC 100828 / KAW 2/3) TaxID=1122961 RepID=Q6L0Q7_PICTO|nr:TldD/PmbA family protein [Picrophilus oshimae]AAT43445.1 zinc metalloprotease [Picrophilus oshimae DSM 9789]SMD30246.1 TldD protein [Picrophilus oshimae DSM 9789]
MIDKILDYASKRSRYADVRYISMNDDYFNVRNGEFQGIERSSSSGYAVRVINNSIAMAYITDFDRDKIDVAIKKSMMPGKNIIDESGGIKSSWNCLGKRKIDDVDLSEKISFLMDLDRLMLENDASVRINGLNETRVNEIYLNTSGSEIKSEYSRIFYFYMAGIEDSGDFEESFQEYGCTGGYDYIYNLNLDERIKNDINSLKMSLKSNRIEPGRYDVMVGPEISGIVAHESAGHPMEYDRIIGREAAQAGKSFINKKMRIGSEHVNVVDDPEIKNSYGFYLYDDEGSPAKKRYLYKNGMVNEYILNRESAGILSQRSNGGGRSSSWNMEPLARMSTTYIEPGDYKFDELIEDIKNGVYIKSFTEWNIDDLRFNEKYVGKEAYIIKNGRIENRVRRPVIETNTVNFYSSIDAVGNDLEFSAGTCGKGDPEQGVPVWMGGPHLRLRNLYIK